MGRVPVPDTSPIGIVGSGRVARHFHHYLTLLGLPVRTWCRREPHTGPVDTLAPCATVLVLIRDSEIDSFVDAWPALKEKRLVHFAGSLVTGAAEVAHPLMTFGHALYDVATYRSIPFVLDCGGTPFEKLLPGLPNRSFTVPAADRPYYHALCVMAGNFSTILWLKLFDELQTRFGIPAAAAHPYLQQTAANLFTGGERSLTGPLARGDGATIAANLKALEGDPFRAVYSAFARAYERRS
jgi:hypothetical protein